MRFLLKLFFYSVLFIVFLIIWWIILWKSGLIPEWTTNKIALSALQTYIETEEEKAWEYSWNQKMTLEIEMEDGKAYSGSSIMKIIWEENRPRINDARWNPDMIWEMPFIKMSDKEYIFVTSKNSRRDMATIFLMWEEKVWRWTNISDIEKALNSSQIIKIDPDNVMFPYIVRFNDITDLSSIEYFSDSTSIQNIHLLVEKTNEQYSSGNIDLLLPELKEMKPMSSTLMPTKFILPSWWRSAVYFTDLVWE